MTEIELTPELRERIQALSVDPAFDALISALIRKYLSSWQTTLPEQAVHREHLYRMVLAAEALRNEVAAIAADHRVTAHNNRLRSTADKKGR
jgi:hypothetical protein